MGENAPQDDSVPELPVGKAEEYAEARRVEQKVADLANKMATPPRNTDVTAHIDDATKQVLKQEGHK